MSLTNEEIEETLDFHRKVHQELTENDTKTIELLKIILERLTKLEKLFGIKQN